MNQGQKSSRNTWGEHLVGTPGGESAYKFGEKSRLRNSVQLSGLKM